MINQRESHHWHSPSYRISVRTRWQDKWSNTIQCWSGMVLKKVTDLQQPYSPTKLVWEDLTNLQKPETGRLKPLWKWREMNSVTGKGMWTSKVTTINQIDGKPLISETLLVSCDASVKVTHTCATVTPKWRAPTDQPTRGLSPITRTHLLLRALPACLVNQFHHL